MLYNRYRVNEPLDALAVSLRTLSMDQGRARRKGIGFEKQLFYVPDSDYVQAILALRRTINVLQHGGDLLGLHI
jgi:hypothetical protein